MNSEGMSLKEIPEEYDDPPEECETCDGDGVVLAQEYYCDYINYSDDEYIGCPSCKGTGWVRSVAKGGGRYCR